MAKKVELEDVPQEEDTAEEDVASQIAKLGAELSAVASNKAKRTAKLREVEAFLGRLKVEDFPELAESPTIQAFAKLLGGSLKPGETRNPGTLAETTREWTMEDLRSFPKKTFTPLETLSITWNGIPCLVTAGEEVSIPEPFYDIYMAHVRAVKNGEQHKKWLLGQTTLAPDRNWLTDASMRVRGYTELGKGSLGTGPLSDADEGDVAETSDAS